MKNSTIIIVDDTPHVCDLVQKVVNHLYPDKEVLIFGDGIDALAYLKTTTPELIITDIQMPQLNGYALVEFVYQNLDEQTVPIILLSALAASNDDLHIRNSLESLGLPRLPILSKPVNVRDLQNEITQAIDNQMYIA